MFLVEPAPHAVTPNMSNVIRFAGRGEPRTVLLVQPHAPSRIEIASYLRNRDYCVVEAINGDEALRLLRSGRIAHVLLSDIDLPETAGGHQLAAAVAREFPHVKLLQRQPRERRSRAVGWGGTKPPTDLRRLERALRDALADHIPHN